MEKNNARKLIQLILKIVGVPQTMQSFISRYRFKMYVEIQRSRWDLRETSPAINASHPRA